MGGQMHMVLPKDNETINTLYVVREEAMVVFE